MNRRGIVLAIFLSAQSAAADTDSAVTLRTIDPGQPEGFYAIEPSCTVTFERNRLGVAVSTCTCEEMWSLVGYEAAAWLLIYERACGPFKVEMPK